MQLFFLQLLWIRYDGKYLHLQFKDVLSMSVSLFPSLVPVPRFPEYFQTVIFDNNATETAY